MPDESEKILMDRAEVKRYEKAYDEQTKKLEAQELTIRELQKKILEFTAKIEKMETSGSESEAGGSSQKKERPLERNPNVDKGRDPALNHYSRMPTWGLDSGVPFSEHLEEFRLFTAATAPEREPWKDKYALYSSLQPQAKARAAVHRAEISSNFTTFEKFEELLRKVFEPVAGSEYSRAMFHGRTQKPKESLHSYINSKHFLFTSAFPAKSSEVLDIYYAACIKGLINVSLKHELLKATFTSPDHFRETCQLTAAIILRQRENKCGYSDLAAAGMDGLEESLADFRFDSSTTPMELGAFEGNCRNCNAYGHKIVECRKPGGGASKQPAARGRGRGRGAAAAGRQPQRGGHSGANSGRKSAPGAGGGGNSEKNRTQCGRCGRGGHQRAACHAKRHSRGYVLKDQKQVAAMEDREDNLDEADPEDDGLTWDCLSFLA